MDEHALSVLTVLAQAHGTPLAAGKLPKDKPAKAAIPQLLEAGHIAETAKKFTITPTGLALWKDNAPSAQVSAYTQTVREREDTAIDALLEAVAKSKGKPFKPADLKKHTEATIALATERRLVQVNAASGYDLTEAGGMQRESKMPLPEQVVILRKLFTDISYRLHLAVRTLENTVPKLADLGITSASAAMAEQSLNAERALADLKVSLTGIEKQTQLHDLAAELLAKKQEQDQILGRVHEQQTQIDHSRTALETTAQGIIAPLKHQFERMEERLTTVEAKAAAAPVAAPMPAPQLVAPPLPVAAPIAAHQPADVWSATRTAYAALKPQGVVRIPELSDRVHQELPDVSPSQFRELLRQWAADDKLVLQVCNDRHLEPRTNEGIESGSGLLFYVQLHA